MKFGDLGSLSYLRRRLVAIKVAMRRLYFLHPSNSTRLRKGNLASLPRDRLFTTISCTGSANSIQIDRSVKLRFCAIIIYGNDCRLEIGEGASLNGVALEVFGSGSRLRIGAGTSIGSGLIAAHWGRQIIIGEDCMLSTSIDIRTTDSHSMVDSSGARINPDRDVVISDRVWVGRGVTILKGASLGAGSIIGTMSLVSGSIPSNVVAAGVPARVIKHSVSWIGDRL